MKKLLFSGLAVFALCVIILLFWVVLILSDLPDVSVLKNYRPTAAAEILDKDGHVLAQYFDRKFRIWIPISSLPDIVIQTVVTAEDDMFFEHRGVNYKATWDALVHDMQKRRFARGGSTITQQMIKNVLLSREKTITRKVREYVLARKAEEILTKRQILQIYLNEVEWGDNVYGIEAASRFYLDKHAAELTPGEAALLAGMLPSPRYFNPYKRPDKARDRQARVLGNMLQAKMITAADYEEGMRSALNLRPENVGRFYSPVLKTTNGKPCYQYALEQILLRVFGDQHLYRGGLTIKTSLDKNMQDEISRLEDPQSSKAADAPGAITVIKQGGRIRALVCSAEKETEIRDRLPALVFPVTEYDVSSVPLDSIGRKEIVLSVEGEKQ